MRDKVDHVGLLLSFVIFFICKINANIVQKNYKYTKLENIITNNLLQIELRDKVDHVGLLLSFVIFFICRINANIVQKNYKYIKLELENIITNNLL